MLSPFHCLLIPVCDLIPIYDVTLSTYFPFRFVIPRQLICHLSFYCILFCSLLMSWLVLDLRLLYFLVTLSGTLPKSVHDWLIFIHISKKNYCLATAPERYCPHPSVSHYHVSDFLQAIFHFLQLNCVIICMFSLECKPHVLSDLFSLTLFQGLRHVPDT